MNNIKIYKKILIYLIAFAFLFSSSCDLSKNNKAGRDIFSYEYVAPIHEQLDLVDVKLLLPLYYSEQFSVEEIKNAGELLSSKTEEFLNCTVTFYFTDYGGYAGYLEKAVAAGIPYDIIILKQGGSNEFVGTYEFDKERFLYQPWVDKGFIKDITEDVMKFFPKGIVYTDMIDKAKDPDDRIYAIPKVQKVLNAYGALCTKDVLDKYGRKEINTYTDFIDLIDSNLNGETKLNVNLQLHQLLSIYLQEASMIMVSGSIVYDRYAKTVDYLEDTDVPDIVFNKYKQYCDMGVISHKNSLMQSDDDIYIAQYMDYKYINGNGQIPYYAKTAKDHSLLLIGGINNDLYHYSSLTAVAIFTASQQTERALMLLSLLNSGNSEYTEILQFGIEGKHYKTTVDKRIDLISPLEIKILFWGEGLLNFDMDALSSFSFEENSEAWKYCLLNEKNKEVIPGISTEAITTMFSFMPEEIKRLAEKRAFPHSTAILDYFQMDNGVNALLEKLQASRNDDLIDWVKDYLTP